MNSNKISQDLREKLTNNPHLKCAALTLTSTQVIHTQDNSNVKYKLSSRLCDLNSQLTFCSCRLGIILPNPCEEGINQLLIFNKMMTHIYSFSETTIRVVPVSNLYKTSINPNIGSNNLLILLGISIATLMAEVKSTKYFKTCNMILSDHDNKVVVKINFLNY